MIFHLLSWWTILGKLYINRYKLSFGVKGTLKVYLGINVEYDYRNYDMKLSQTKYIKSLTNKYQLQDSRLYSRV